MAVMGHATTQVRDEWATGNKSGHNRALELIERMRETGDPTLLLAECRSLKDAFYGAEGVGFFHAIAAAILDG